MSSRPSQSSRALNRPESLARAGRGKHGSRRLSRNLFADTGFRRSAALWFIAFFVVSSLTAGISVAFVHAGEKSRRLAELKATELGIAFAQMGAVRERLSLIRSDVLFLREMYEMELVQWDGDANPIIAEEFRAFSRTREVYDQIRVILEAGVESLRINLNGRSPIIVAQDRLQDVSGTAYMHAAARLNYGDIFVSRLDLTEDHGQILLPFRPTIRIATPLRSPEGGRLGYLVLNYLASSMLTAVEAAADLSNGDPMMLNAEGFWLVSNGPLKWGFMFDDRSEERMAARLPRTWAALHADTSGQVLTDEGLFTYSAIDPVKDIMSGVGDFEGFASPRASASVRGTGQLWYVGTFIDREALEKLVGEPSSASLFYGGLIMVLCAAGSAAAAFAIAEAAQYRKMLERLATYDNLTGLPNRRALEERLQADIRRSIQTGHPVMVGFVDIDGFKQINDELGHSAGDAALSEIAAVIDTALRDYDAATRMATEPPRSEPMAARIGGDEFVIVLPDPAGIESSALFVRLVREIDSLSWSDHTVSASVGIATFPNHGATWDQVLKRADQAMYEAKAAGKNQIVQAGGTSQSVTAEA